MSSRQYWRKMHNLRWFWHTFYWGGTVYPIVTGVSADGYVEYYKVTLSAKFLNWHAQRKHRLIRHRWHKWINPLPRKDYPSISRFECKHCHIWCYMATPSLGKERQP